MPLYVFTDCVIFHIIHYTCISLSFFAISKMKTTHTGKGLLTLEDTKGPKEVVTVSPLFKVRNTGIIGMNV